DRSLFDANLRNSLPRQRWGIVVPKGQIGQELLGRIQRLRDRRAEQQKADALVYEVDPGMDAEQASEWISREYLDAVSRDRRIQPRSLLVLGGPDLVSWELQQMLGVESFVGRLAFTDEKGAIDWEGYDAYVDKVLTWERADTADRARALFYTVRD